MGGTYWANRICVRRPPAIGRYLLSPRAGTRQRGDTSSPYARTRRRLIFQRENEVPPRLPADERGDASSPRTGTRRHLVLMWRRDALSSEARRHLVTTPLLKFMAEFLPYLYRDKYGMPVWTVDRPSPRYERIAKKIRDLLLCSLRDGTQKLRRLFAAIRGASLQRSTMWPGTPGRKGAHSG
ncbi:hypothetical protein BHM03_00057066 [Ensete ventricosum]|nr:hypothetical protein BHM03_00057066 [Ensete ventricosum]